MAPAKRGSGTGWIAATRQGPAGISAVVPQGRRRSLPLYPRPGGITVEKSIESLDVMKLKDRLDRESPNNTDPEKGYTQVNVLGEDADSTVEYGAAA